MLSFAEFLSEDLTLRYHNTLNQKLFDGETLKPEVRITLINIAKAWQKSAMIPDSIVKDIIFTGGNANFNYTKYSDIDVDRKV
jgi:hypothetical protein